VRYLIAHWRPFGDSATQEQPVARTSCVPASAHARDDEEVIYSEQAQLCGIRMRQAQSVYGWQYDMKWREHWRGVVEKV
jgi:hypothetical protein